MTALTARRLVPLLALAAWVPVYALWSVIK